MTKEKEHLDLDSSRFAKMTVREKAEALYTGKYKLLGNSSHWAAANPTEANEARRIARDELGVSLGSDRQERVEELLRPKTNPQQVSELELAEAIKEYPRERCVELFRKEADKPGESSTKLSAAEYQKAKTAARFFGVLPPEGSGADVRFAYETPEQRRQKREAREAAQAVQQAEVARKDAGLSESGLPPGITRNEKGEFLLSDAVAFNAWKADQAAKSEAREIIAKAK